MTRDTQTKQKTELEMTKEEFREFIRSLTDVEFDSVLWEVSYKDGKRKQ